MANLAKELPSLQTADMQIGVTKPASSNSITDGGPGISVGVNKTAADNKQINEMDTINNTITSNSAHTNNNNTVSAAADSSDNQPDTPQPHISNINDIPQNSATTHHTSYGNHQLYGNTQSSTATTTVANSHLNQLYTQNIYTQSNNDLQQSITPTQHSTYPSYLNSYEQFYQQQQQQQQQEQQQSSLQSGSQIQNPQQMEFINSNGNNLYTTTDYKQQSGVRYHPYLNAPISGMPSVNAQNSNLNNSLDANSQTVPIVSSVMSPHVASSTSPSSTSNQMQISGSVSSLGSMSVGNPSSPNSAASLQCKKCGIMCTNESELQNHITNVHGASPYGSSGYASSPYIKDENPQQQQQLQQQQQQQTAAQQALAHGGNAGDILDLDSQKMLYPPAHGSMKGIMQRPLGNTDPLHGLHSMQQRAGVNSWDQQTQEGQTPYLQPQQQATDTKILPDNSHYYQSHKQPPYDITNNSTNVIKTEYRADNQQLIANKSYDCTAPNQQQQMMPPALSSSPTECPSTTTGGPQDNGQPNVVGNQQFRAGNFEPPSSSSAASTTGPLGGKAANWKSNEARRPKTYNCTACNKWFTSSGHLKRHYNTTLHKNAVKSSGQPDPATLPISVHHHPARDPSGKTGKRGAAAAAAAAAASASNNNITQQLPNPVQPPEPPNSPPDYGGAQTVAGGLTSLSQYTATSSSNVMYQQQHYQQHQYMPQIQSMTSALPQHDSSMGNHHLQQQQQQQQQTIMNGHPNALAGPSVPTTLQQAPTPSSQMRGLLNTTMLPSTEVTNMRIIKSEHLEAAKQKHPMHLDEEVEELVYHTREVKVEYMEETEQVEERNIYSPKADMQSVQGEVMAKNEQVHQESELLQQHQQLQEMQEQEMVLNDVDRNVEHRHNKPQLSALNQMQHFQLQQPQLADNTISSTTLSNMQVHSPLIISNQQYRGQLPQQHQMATQDTYTLIQTPSSQQQQQHNIAERLPYTSMPLDTNMQQPLNNMLQLQQPLTTMEQQQLQPDTTIPITNMVNMLPLNHHHMQQQQQQQHTELQPLVNMQLQLDTINTNIQSHITPINIQSLHHLQQQDSVLQPLEPTLTYPHTITGNTEFLTTDHYGNILLSSGEQHQQLIQNTNGQFIQLIPTDPTSATTLHTTQTYNFNQRSPQQADLPPTAQSYKKDTIALLPTSYCSYSTTQNNIYTIGIDYTPSINTINNNSNNSIPKKETKKKQKKELKHKNANANDPMTSNSAKKAVNKRKRNSSSSSSTEASITVLPNGRIKCLPCDKEFTKMCYLTQHNKSFHSGECPFRCHSCGKRFQRDDVYQIHLEKHSADEKPYKCDICPKQFHHKTDLRRHIEGIHTGNKQHSCEICEKSFCRKDHLRKHIETHNRPRSFNKKTKSRHTKNSGSESETGSTSSTSSTNGTSSISSASDKKNNFSTRNNIVKALPKISKDIIPTKEETPNNSEPSHMNPLNNFQLIETESEIISETNSYISSAISTPSPLSQQTDDLSDNNNSKEVLLEQIKEEGIDELKDYNNQNIGHNKELFMNMEQYALRTHGGKFVCVKKDFVVVYK